MGKQPPFREERAEPELDDPRSRNSLEDFESLETDRIPTPMAGQSPRPPVRSSLMGRLAVGLVGTMGLVWGGLQGYDMFLHTMETRIEVQVAAQRQILTAEMQRLDEQKRALISDKNILTETASKAEQQTRQAIEERKKLKEENQALREELKKQTGARKKAEDDKAQWEKQALEKRQAEEARKQQESAKREEEAKILAVERSRWTAEKKQWEEDKKQLGEDKKQLEALNKAHMEKAKASEAVNTPTIDGVDKDLNSGRLTEPKGHNALEKLEWLSKLDASNKVLPPRWARLAELLVTRADEAMKAKDLTSAENQLKIAEKIPGSKELVAKVKQRLAKAQEASRLLDLEVLRQAEDEEVARRLEQQRSSTKPSPPLIRGH